MLLNQLIRDVHQNAVDHGWWDKPRSVGNTRAMIHDEVSEALGEYRNGNAIYYHVCPKNKKVCEQQDFPDSIDCTHCTPCQLKAEGTAVELADMAIRIFDLLGSHKVDVIEDEVTLQMLIDTAIEEHEEFENESCPDILHAEVPDLCNELHTLIVLDRFEESDYSYLLAAIGVAGAWVNEQLKDHELDFEKIVLEKHAYNKTRSYRHGNKLC